MRFRKIRWKNLLSYGNKVQEYVFSEKPELVLIEGENGAGKSSIKEALTVSAYGRSAIRKMKDLPNWINKSAYTYNEIETSRGDIVVVERGIDPNFTQIQINGVSHNLPDKRKIDEFIEDEILGLNFSTFCNTISLSFDDFKSFINLTASDKRKIVDPIFGIDILSEMRSRVKEDLKESSKNLDAIDLSISKNENLLEKSIEQLKSLKKKISDDTSEKKEKLKTDIESKKKNLDDKKKIFTDLKTEIDDLTSNVTKHTTNIAKSKANIAEFDKKLKIYQSNKCPHCLSDLTGESSIKIKSAIEKKKEDENKLLSDLNDAYKSISDKIKNLKQNQETAKSDFYDIKSSLTTLESSLSALENDKESDHEESIRSIISTIREEISNSKEESKKYSDEKDLYQSLDEVLSDGGIKRVLIERVIPLLNGRITEISERLDFKFTFHFDSEFNPVINHLGMEVSPESLSTGQRKKMNLIVLLSFIELIKMKHNKMNVMFLDEIFSGLDKINVYKAIEVLREYADRYGMTIFVVSHESLPEEFFDKKIHVTMPNHFSEMKIVETTHQN
jgi:DNA repair exonuclease SbcCD ATPase subunit